MKANGYDTEKILPIIEEFIKAAYRRGNIVKPVSWALYQTWKTFDVNEKPIKKCERKDGEQDEAEAES